MADFTFDEDTIQAEDPDEVIAADGAAAFDYDSSETLITDTDVWPGQWSIEPSPCARDIDKKKPWGKSGYKTRDKGLKGSTVRALGTLTESDRARVGPLVAKYVPTADSGIKTAYTLTHPDCNEIGINAVYVESLVVKSPKTGRDFHEVDIVFSQWFPEPKDVPEPVPNTAGEAAFQALQQDPGPFGPTLDEVNAPTTQNQFANDVGRFADAFKAIHAPDQAIPAYTEP